MNNADRIEAKPFGNGIDVCPVCGKPSAIGKPITNTDRIRAMTDEELAEFIARQRFSPINILAGKFGIDVTLTTQFIEGRKNALDWLKQEVENES